MWNSSILWLLVLIRDIQEIKSSCTVNFNGYGDFIFTGLTVSTCSVEIKQWAGQTVTQTINVDSTTPKLTRTQLIGRGRFVYGLQYQFKFGVSNCGNCNDKTLSVTPPLCSNTISESSYILPIIKPSRQVQLVVENSPPSTSDCIFLVVDSSAPTTRTESAPVNCSPPPLPQNLPSFTANKIWWINVVRYTASTYNIATDPPSCGVSEAAVSTPICATGAPVVSLGSWYSLKVTIGTTPSPSALFKCLVTLTKTNGGVSISVSKLSDDCTSVVFGAQDTGYQYSEPSSTNVYTVHYYSYANNKIVNVDNPDCVSAETSQTAALRPTTLGTSSFAVSRPDPSTIRATTGLTYSFGTCEVRLKKIASTVKDPPISRFGPCNGKFDFIVDGTNIAPWVDTNGLEFDYLFYPTGDILSTTMKLESPTVGSLTVDQFACPSIAITENPTGTFTFTSSSPPVSGGCALDFGKTNKINWPGCDKIQINYYDMLSVDPSIGKPGTDFTFKLFYYVNGYSSTATRECESSPSETKKVFLYYGLKLVSATATSLTLERGVPINPPASLSNYFTTNSIDSVTVSLYSCDASVATSVVEKAINTPYTGSVTFNSGEGGVTIASGASCIFDVKVRTSNDGNGVGVYSGYSGKVSFMAAAPPSLVIYLVERVGRPHQPALLVLFERVLIKTRLLLISNPVL
jgi:hypothetical protein